MHFVIFHLQDTPTFKTKVLRLASNERGLQHILLRYKQIIQSFLAVTGDAFVTRATPIVDIDGKNHKTELKSSRYYSTNHIKPKSRH